MSGALLAGMLAASEGAAAQSAATRAYTVALRAEVASLEGRVKLATGKGFYLVLDAQASELRLMFGGALLQQFRVASMEVGRPRLAFRSLGSAISWPTAAWESGTLTPPRPVEPLILEPPPPGAEGAETLIPPTADEAIAVPRRYFVRFPGGLALDINQATDLPDRGVRARWRRTQDRWTDVAAVLAPTRRDAVRIRLVLEKSIAEALYRSVPEEVGFWIALGPTT